MSTTPTPEEIVQRQLTAYNARDLDALLATYSDDAELFEHPATLLASGKSALRERFAARFREAKLHAELLYRTVLGSKVVDHERVTRTFPDGPGEIEVLMTYEVKDGTIVRAWSIAGTRKLHLT